MKTHELGTVPILDVTPEVEALWEELMAAAAGVLRSGEYIMGPNVKAFEAEVAAYLGVKHAIGVNSGTDALVIALEALGIGPGDDVITTPFTFFATAEAISHLGATPVFADIDPATFNLDPADVRARLTPRTKAIIPVHLYGHAAEMDALLALAADYGLKVVEDVAQCFGGSYRGQKVGTFGDFGAFSFFPTKNLGGFGDGGLVTTNDDALAERARMLRVHGARKKYHNEMVGYNSRLDELQAALLRVKLKRIDTANAGRRRVAQRYEQLLSGVRAVIPPSEAPGVEHVFHQYTVRLPGRDRDAVQARLQAAGISTMVYYPVPVHRLPVYAGRYGRLPIAEALTTEVLSLPIWPQLDDRTAERVVTALKAALEEVPHAQR